MDVQLEVVQNSFEEITFRAILNNSLRVMATTHPVTFIKRLAPPWKLIKGYISSSMTKFILLAYFA